MGQDGVGTDGKEKKFSHDGISNLHTTTSTPPPNHTIPYHTMTPCTKNTKRFLLNHSTVFLHFVSRRGIYPPPNRKDAFRLGGSLAFKLRFDLWILSFEQSWLEEAWLIAYIYTIF